EARGQLLYNAAMTVYSCNDILPAILIPVHQPDYPRPNVDEVAAAIDVLFDPTIIREVEVVDHVHPLEPWIRQTTGASVPSETSGEAVVTLFRPITGKFKL